MAVNWNDLRYFLTVSRKNTFLAAAAELRVTHTTVSRRISTLEDSLQTLLFERSEKGCILTPPGERLLQFAEQLENTVATLEDSVSGSNQQISGTIRIGAPDGIGTCYMPALLARLQDKHPSLEIELIAVPNYSSLSKREVDILITVQKPRSGNIFARKLTDYRLGLFASGDYLRRTPAISAREDLKSHRIIGYIDDLLFDSDLQFMEEILPGLSPQFRSTTVMAQMNGVAAGIGIGVIPYFMAHGDPRLLPVLPDIRITRGYWLRVNPESRKLLRVRTAIDFFAAQMQADGEIFHALPRRG